MCGGGGGGDKETGFYIPSLTIFAFSSQVPSRAPGRVVLHTTSAHSVRVEWGPVPPKYTHGIVLGYKVMYENKLSRVRRSTTHAGVISTVTVNATSLNTEIRGLKPYTAYLVWVLAFTVAGNGPRSSKVEIRTDEDGKQFSKLTNGNHRERFSKVL